MPVKIARSTPRPSFGLPEPLVGIHTSRQSCCKAAKARIFTPVRESSGESRSKGLLFSIALGLVGRKVVARFSIHAFAVDVLEFLQGEVTRSGIRRLELQNGRSFEIRRSARH